jgi:hypothetical protein
MGVWKRGGEGEYKTGVREIEAYTTWRGGYN